MKKYTSESRIMTCISREHRRKPFFHCSAALYTVRRKTSTSNDRITGLSVVNLGILEGLKEASLPDKRQIMWNRGHADTTNPFAKVCLPKARREFYHYVHLRNDGREEQQRKCVCQLLAAI